LLWSAVASPIQGYDYAGIKVGLQQGFVAGEMGFNDKFELQKSSTVLVRFGSWLFANSTPALALPATDAAVIGTSALYGHQLAALEGPQNFFDCFFHQRIRASSQL
jgi:hypothetical protein